MRLVLAVSFALAVAGSAFAGQAPFPRFAAGQHVYVSGTSDSGYDSLRDRLAGLRSRAGAQYLVVIVGEAEGSGSPEAAKRYADALYDRWVAEGALAAGLDGRRHVLIVHSIDDRSVGVHWGAEWDGLGFHGEAGARVIDRSEFIPLARSGMMADADWALIEQIDSELEAAIVAGERRAAQLRAALPARLTAARAEIARVRAGRDGGHTDVAAILARAEARAREAEDALGAGNTDRADLLATAAASEADSARRLAASYASRRWLVTRALPIGGATLALLGLGIALLLIVRARRRWRAALDGEVDAWRDRLSPAAVRLLELEEKYAIFFRSPVELARRLEGDSARRWKEVGEVVDGLALLFDAAMQRVEDARRRGAAAHALAWRPLRAAVRELEAGEILITAEVKADRRKLFLPEPRVEKVPVPDVFRELDDRYGRAVDELDRLHADWRAAPEAVQALARTLDAVGEASAAVAACDLPLAPYAEERDRLEQAHRAASARLATDFLGARAVADEARAGAAALAERLAAVAARARRLAEELEPAAGRVAARVKELRATGLRVREPVFDPDAALADARRLMAEARDRLAAGDGAAGAALVDDAAAALAAAGEAVEATVRARAESPGALADRRRLLAELRGRAEVGRRVLAELAARFAPSSFAVEADNLEECAALFDQIDELCRGAEEDGGAAAQRYLAAAEKLGRGGNALGAIAELLDEIDAKRAAIEAAAERARRTAAQAAAAREALAAHVAQHDHAVGRARIETAAASAPALAELEEHMAGARPDWFALEARASSLAVAVADAQAAAQRDVELHDAARAEVAAADDVVTRVAAELAAARDDRPPANARLAAAREELERARAGLAEAHGDWEVCLAAARAATALAGSALELAARDAELAQSARAAIAAAESAIRHADRYYGHGVNASLAGAKLALGDARGALAALKYEDALKAAERASASASSAERSAEAEVRRKQEAERERARLASAAAAALRSSRSSGRSWSSRATSSSSGRSWGGSSSSGRGYGGSRSSGRGY